MHKKFNILPIFMKQAMNYHCWQRDANFLFSRSEWEKSLST